MSLTGTIYGTPSAAGIAHRLRFLANEEHLQLIAFDALKPRLDEVWRAVAVFTEEERRGVVNSEQQERALAEAMAVSREADELVRRQKLLWAEVEELTAQMDQI